MTFPSSWAVPQHSVAPLTPKSNKYCLVIPVINEGERIRSQLARMHQAGIPRLADIIIADGGSTDGSLETEFLQHAGVTALLTKHDNGRLSAQLRMGYAWALEQEYAGIITMDGNGKDSEESVPLFINALDKDIDYAQASRFITGGESVNAPWVRLVAIRLVHAPCISLAARHWFTDTTQGFRAYSRRYLLDDRVQPFRTCFMDYELLAYLSIRATQLGYNAQEIPTRRAYPASGAVPTKISPVHGSLDLLKTLAKACLGFYNP